MNHLLDKSPKRKKFILTVSLIGIALMAALALLTIPMEYQLIAILYANKTLTPIIETTVFLLIATGAIAFLLPGK